MLIPSIICFSTVLFKYEKSKIILKISFVCISYILFTFANEIIFDDYIINDNIKFRIAFNILFLFSILLLLLGSIPLKFIKIKLGLKVRSFMTVIGIIVLIWNSTAWPIFYTNSGYIQTNNPRKKAMILFNKFSEIYDGSNLILYTKEFNQYYKKVIIPLQIISNIKDENIKYYSTFSDLNNYAKSINKTFYFISDYDLDNYNNGKILKLIGNGYRGLSIYSFDPVLNLNNNIDKI